MDSMKTEKM